MQKWDKNKVIEEAQYLINTYGDIPSRAKLKNLQKIDFLMAIRRHYPGQMNKLRSDLGLKSKHRATNYWMKNTVISETKRIIEIVGHMPTQKQLRDFGVSVIINKSIEYFGGLRGLAIACGVCSENLPVASKYWQDFKNIKKEILSINHMLGRFPVTNDFVRLGKGGLLSAIMKYHGGLRNLKHVLKYKGKYPIAKDGHACDSYSEVIVDDFLLANNISHRRDIQFNFGNIKCRPDFVLNNGTLIEVLMADYRKKNYRGKLKYYVERYSKKKEAYLLYNYKVIEVFPAEIVDQKKLTKKLLTIAKASNAQSPHNLSNFTSISFFNKKSPGFWKNPDNLKTELFPLIKKFGHMPTICELRSAGRNDVEGAIMNVYGSFWNAAKAIGLNTAKIKKPSKYWKNAENIKNELLPIIEEYGYLPSRTVLMKKGMRSVVAAIDAYHHSFAEISRTLKVAYSSEKRKNGYWLNEINIRNELERIIEKIGRFPTAQEINDFKLSGMLKGILFTYGSLRKAAEQLILEIPKNKPKGYWKDLNNVLYEFYLLVERFKRFPNYGEIERHKSMLCYAIKNYHGGIKRVRSRYILFANNRGSTFVPAI